jgi:hypothetical protein
MMQELFHLINLQIKYITSILKYKTKQLRELLKDFIKILLYKIKRLWYVILIYL